MHKARIVGISLLALLFTGFGAHLVAVADLFGVKTETTTTSPPVTPIGDRTETGSELNPDG